MGSQRADFADFYREVKDECLVTVLVSVGDREAAEDLVAEAFARAWRRGGRSAGTRPRRRGWYARR